MECSLNSIRRILLPIQQNLTLFVISILLLGGLDVFYHQYIFHENNIWGMLLSYGEMIMMAYLVCLCSHWLRKIHLKVVFYIILFAIYAVNCYLRLAFSTDFSPKILMLLFETNSKEVSGFFSTYFFTPAMYKTITVVTVFLLLTIVGELFRKKLYQISAKPIISWILIPVLLLGAVGGTFACVRYGRLAMYKDAFEAERWLLNIPFRKGMPIPNLCYSLDAIRLSGQDLNYMINATESALDDVTTESSDSLNIILVIGESYNKYRSSLYGYDLNTTPFQCEERDRGNLYAFTHVKAPHNMTSIVMKNVLCCNNVHEGERWYNYPYFPAIFKKAGYDVWFWDNQYKWDPDAAWAFTLNSVLFNEQIQKMSYNGINENGAPFDGGLIADFEQQHKSTLGNRNFIIFHLGGQHFLAKNQYPQEAKYNIFSAKDVKDKAPYLNDESRQRIAEYANATHYNDSVIRQIMDLVKETNALLIYFPDHGEEVYDYRDFYGRQLLSEDKITPELIKYQIEIPFIIWCSDKWKLSHEKEWETIGQALHREFSTDNVCHLLFRLAGIKTKVYQPERDLFSPEFIPQTKEYDMLGL